MPTMSRMCVSGVVLQVDGRRAVVLADGRFLRLRSVAGWQPGQEVWLAMAPLEAAERWRRALTAAVAVAGTAAVVLSGGAVAAALPVAVVSVDLSPGVQLAVNHWARVVHATALGPGGSLLLERAGPLDHLPLDQAVSHVVQGAMVAGAFRAPFGAAATPRAAGLQPAATPRAATARPVQPAQGGLHAAGPTRHASGSAPEHQAPALVTPAEARTRTRVPPTRGTDLAGGGDGGGPVWPETVLIAVAPLRGGKTSVPSAVAAEVASAAGDVRGLLARGDVPPAVVAVVRGRAADVRAARRDSVTLGEYILARDLQAHGAPLTPRAFAGEPVATVLARAGVSRAAALRALREMEGGSPPHAVPAGGRPRPAIGPPTPPIRPVGGHGPAERVGAPAAAGTAATPEAGSRARPAPARSVAPKEGSAATVGPRPRRAGTAAATSVEAGRGSGRAIPLRRWSGTHPSLTAHRGPTTPLAGQGAAGAQPHAAEARGNGKRGGVPVPSGSRHPGGGSRLAKAGRRAVAAKGSQGPRGIRSPAASVDAAPSQRGKGRSARWPGVRLPAWLVRPLTQPLLRRSRPSALGPGGAGAASARSGGRGRHPSPQRGHGASPTGATASGGAGHALRATRVTQAGGGAAGRGQGQAAGQPGAGATAARGGVGRALGTRRVARASGGVAVHR